MVTNWFVSDTPLRVPATTRNVMLPDTGNGPETEFPDAVKINSPGSAIRLLPTVTRRSGSLIPAAARLVRYAAVQLAWLSRNEPLKYTLPVELLVY